MKKILLMESKHIRGIIFILLMVFISSFMNYAKAEDFSKLLLGFSSSYINYYPLENSSGLGLSGNKFLIGVNIGFASKGVVFDFSYVYKVYPNDKYMFSGYNLLEQFDSYVFSFSYVFTIITDKLYLGPFLGLSIDNSLLKLYNNFNFSSFLSNAEVKEIVSKVISLGVGGSIIIFRNIVLNIGYFYSLPSTYSYQGINMSDSFIFQPSGLRVILNINI